MYLFEKQEEKLSSSVERKKQKHYALAILSHMAHKKVKTAIFLSPEVIL